MEKIDFTNPDYEFDDIAEQVFYPIYDVIAQDLLEETGIVSGSMLDVGCGGGHLGFAVMGKSDLTGDFVDINATAVRLAEERSKRLGVWERSRFYRADVVSLPFEDQSFDLVISRGSMFFWEDQERAFSEILRVLKPGGQDLHRRRTGQALAAQSHYGADGRAGPGLAWPSEGRLHGAYGRGIPESGRTAGTPAVHRGRRGARTLAGF